MINGAGEPAMGPDTPQEDQSAARALSLHLLRMVETRVEATSIAVQGELQSFSTRLQLKLLAAGALFIAIWGGIVLVAIALPPQLRIPVLSVVVAAFVVAAIWAQMAAKATQSSTAVGSLRWLLEGFKLDLEVLSRSLGHHKAHAAPPPEANRSPPSDIAA